ncbi:hypothetical protein J2747_001645 [Thermococcus stetteri]|nr:hypothetical protein [Thermococcus stetteri]
MRKAIFFKTQKPYHNIRMKRAVTVKLQPSREQEKTLFELAHATAIIWNKLNYQRLKQFKEFGKIDFSTTEKEAYHEFKNWIGGSTVQQLARKNAESWRSFFSLTKRKSPENYPNGSNQNRLNSLERRTAENSS